MKKKKKKQITINKKEFIIILVFAIILLFTPIKKTYLDGGTKEYSAIMYKIIVWNKIDNYYESGYKTNTEIHIFPFNFRSIDYYYEKDIHPSGLFVHSTTDSIMANIGSYNWCNKYNDCISVDKLMVDDFSKYKSLTVGKGSTIKLIGIDQIKDFKIYKNDINTKYDKYLEYDNNHLIVPNEEGAYLIHLLIEYNNKNSVDYFFVINVE